MNTYRLTPEAREDIRKIIRYTVDTWGKKQADKYVSSLENCFSNLESQHDFIRCVSVESNLYTIICEHHYIFFFKQQPVEIIAILHKKMDLMVKLKNRLDS